MTAVFQRGSGGQGRRELLRELASRFEDDMQVWQLTREAALQDIKRDVRLESLELLAYEQEDVPTTWQLIQEAVTKDADSRVRRRACALLLKNLNCSDLQRNLMIIDWRYGFWAHDLKQPITSARMTEAAQQFNLSVDEVRQQYAAIAAQFPLELILEWRKGS
jgi:hypothetical protein